MEMRIGRQREVDRKGRESEHKQENEKRLKSIQRFFFLILGFEAFAASDASSDREEQREPKARLSPSYGLPCVAQVAFFHRGRDYADVHCPRLYEVKRRWEREREASLMPCAPAFLAQLIHYGSDSCLLS